MQWYYINIKRGAGSCTESFQNWQVRVFKSSKAWRKFWFKVSFTPYPLIPFIISYFCLQKHGTTAKPLKPARLDSEEQEKIAKTGQEMKEATNEMEGEADKWNADENNDIVKRAKNMSAMALSMYQFTKGEGNLRTTQDLFTQAEYFAEEANRLYKVVRQFSYQVNV